MHQRAKMNVAVIAIFSLYCKILFVAGMYYPELRKDLERYHDPHRCTAQRPQWYMAYRNYYYDPFYGGTAHCVKFQRTAPPKISPCQQNTHGAGHRDADQSTCITPFSLRQDTRQGTCTALAQKNRRWFGTITPSMWTAKPATSDAIVTPVTDTVARCGFLRHM
uniref:Putative salivary lipocalin n=1 Tax=Rhipicephalus microplus TaxID=6941 RepID=A0A6G5A568_RHIMP